MGLEICPDGKLRVAGSGKIRQCSCSDGCDVIGRSLCGSVPEPCGFAEFTAAAAGSGTDCEQPEVTASCPPKFYRAKTVVHDYSGNVAHHTGPGDDTWTYAYNTTETWTKGVTEGSCVSAYSASGTSSSAWNTASDGDPYATPDYSCSSSMVDGAWDGYGICGEWLHGPAAINCLWIEGVGDWTTQCIIKTATSIVETYTQSISNSCEAVTRTHTITTTLSDEIPLSDSLEDLICDETTCVESDANPDCRYCCTDRGGDREGLVFGSTPEGCITPSGSLIAWDNSDCSGGTTRAGRSTDLSIWFKDLVPGETYTATLTYKRCAFPVDPETSEPIVPDCLGGPCGSDNPEDYDTLTDEVVFVATDWAEILSRRCDGCDILLKKCALEDEANDWNLANPEETPRTVACTTGGFSIPTTPNTYTWLESCSLVAGGGA